MGGLGLLDLREGHRSNLIEPLGLLESLRDVGQLLLGDSHQLFVEEKLEVGYANTVYQILSALFEVIQSRCRPLLGAL